MNLSELLSIKFPSANFTKDIRIRDDGNGSYIEEWNFSDPQPTQDQITQWLNDATLQQQYQFNQNKLTNQHIYDQLAELDNKSIRALRENDAARIVALNSEATVLREALLPVK